MTAAQDPQSSSNSASSSPNLPDQSGKKPRRNRTWLLVVLLATLSVFIEHLGVCLGHVATILKTLVDGLSRLLSLL